jgi:hypothetical protein
MEMVVAMLRHCQTVPHKGAMVTMDEDDVVIAAIKVTVMSMIRVGVKGTPMEAVPVMVPVGSVTNAPSDSDPTSLDVGSGRSHWRGLRRRRKQEACRKHCHRQGEFYRIQHMESSLVSLLNQTNGKHCAGF